jgi:hypothetical protein
MEDGANLALLVMQSSSFSVLQAQAISIPLAFVLFL